MKYCELYFEDIQRAIDCIPNIEELFEKKILITGATGLICSAVVDILFYLNSKRNANISIILAGRDKNRISERFCNSLGNSDYEFLQYDATSDVISDFVADYVIHGASNADPKSISEHPIDTMIANIIGVYSLLKHAKSIQRFLYISSSEIYGKKTSTSPYKEDDYNYIDILNPRASYPSSKRAAETLCAAYSKEYDLDFVIVRPGHIYGPTSTNRDSRACAQFQREAAMGRNIVMKSTGRQLRSYCYCLDCASAILTVLIKGEKGNAYNISNKDSIVTIRQMAESFAKVGKVSISFEIPTEQETESYNLMDNSSLDSSKLELLGWRAVFSLLEGAEHTLRLIDNRMIIN